MARHSVSDKNVRPPLRQVKGAKPPAHLLVRFSWTDATTFNRGVRLDLPSASAVDLCARPMMRLRLRSSRAGRFMKLRLIGTHGRCIDIPLNIERPGRWLTLGPFAPGLSEAGRKLGGLQSIALLKTTTPRAPSADDVERERRRAEAELPSWLPARAALALVLRPRDALTTVEVASIDLTAEAHHLRDALAPEDKSFAEAVAKLHDARAHVVLALDASHLWQDDRRTAASLFDWVKRTAAGAPEMKTDASGRTRFTLAASDAWGDELARCAGELMRHLGVDGVYLVHLPEADDKALGAMLKKVRRAVKSTNPDGVLFVEGATATTLRYADVTMLDPSMKLADFRYAAAGIAADIAVRTGDSVDTLHLASALGLKSVVTPRDVGRKLDHRPGTLVVKGVEAAAGTIGEEDAEADAEDATRAAYGRSLGERFGEVERFYDAQHGARWCGLVYTGVKGFHIIHLSRGREHLYAAFNTSDRPAGPLILDVSHTGATAFTDALTGLTLHTRDGYLTLTLQPHSLALLNSSLESADVR